MAIAIEPGKITVKLFGATQLSSTHVFTPSSRKPDKSSHRSFGASLAASRFEATSVFILEKK
jgi:hypothetical protein